MCTFYWIISQNLFVCVARVEEEMGASSGNAKLTNQMFVPAAHSGNSSSNMHVNNNNISSNNHTHSDGPDSLNATYISVVSWIANQLASCLALFHAFSVHLFIFCFIYIRCVHFVFCVCVCVRVCACCCVFVVDVFNVCLAL